MELYLDSANLKEIEEGFRLGFLNGLTTTPTFMQKEGITDIDGTIVKRNSHDWDLAAADLILSRAGGALCSLDGEPLSYNRPTVTHGVLGAASGTALPALLAASRPLEPH